MKILFLTHYFPPEVNAPATRTYEHVKRWVEKGHDVRVITGFPSHPAGQVYEGYEKKFWQNEEIDGIKVLRVWTFISPNKGFIKRILNYVSFMFSAIFFSTFFKRPQVVIATSPQFFCACAGWVISVLKWRPFVFELRDLWPETIITVGAMKEGLIIRFFEFMEIFLYNRARLIVSLTNSFIQALVQKGINPDKIVVVTNGVNLKFFKETGQFNKVKEKEGWQNKFICSYIGTIGICHGLGTIVEAASILAENTDIQLFIMGDGSERTQVLSLMQTKEINNLVMLPQTPKHEMLKYLEASDCVIVHLQKQDLFKTVIPSKIFEAMAMKKPIIMGVEGESREIVMKADCCISFEPENPRELADAISCLASDPNETKRLGENGYKAVSELFNRTDLADKMLKIIEKVI